VLLKLILKEKEFGENNLFHGFDPIHIKCSTDDNKICEVNLSNKEKCCVFHTSFDNRKKATANTANLRIPYQNIMICPLAILYSSA
jgi:hypothetical protein